MQNTLVPASAKSSLKHAVWTLELRGKGDRGKGPATQLELRTYTLSWSFSAIEHRSRVQAGLLVLSPCHYFPLSCRVHTESFTSYTSPQALSDAKNSFGFDL